MSDGPISIVANTNTQCHTPDQHEVDEHEDELVPLSIRRLTTLLPIIISTTSTSTPTPDPTAINTPLTFLTDTSTPTGFPTAFHSSSISSLSSSTTTTNTITTSTSTSTSIATTTTTLTSAPSSSPTSSSFSSSSPSLLSSSLVLQSVLQFRAQRAALNEHLVHAQLALVRQMDHVDQSAHHVLIKLKQQNEELAALQNKLSQLTVVGSMVRRASAQVTDLSQQLSILQGHLRRRVTMSRNSRQLQAAVSAATSSTVSPSPSK